MQGLIKRDKLHAIDGIEKRVIVELLSHKPADSFKAENEILKKAKNAEKSLENVIFERF